MVFLTALLMKFLTVLALVHIAVTYADTSNEKWLCAIMAFLAAMVNLPSSSPTTKVINFNDDDENDEDDSPSVNFRIKKN